MKLLLIAASLAYQNVTTALLSQFLIIGNVNILVTVDKVLGRICARSLFRG